MSDEKIFEFISYWINVDRIKKDEKRLREKSKQQLKTWFAFSVIF